MLALFAMQLPDLVQIWRLQCRHRRFVVGGIEQRARTKNNCCCDHHVSSRHGARLHEPAQQSLPEIKKSSFFDQVCTTRNNLRYRTTDCFT
jgi:hypothetical protein